MDESKAIMNTGLRGITVASTRISDVDGAAGKLLYRGFLAKDLVGKSSFEEIVYLLLYETLPGAEALAQFKSRLSGEVTLPAGVLQALETLPKNALPMDVLQAGISMLAAYDPDIREYSREAALRMAVRLIAKVSAIVATWERIRNNKKPIDPLPELSHAANFLYMISGDIPDDELVGFFDACLVLHAEHSFNASTFSARQVASSRAHIYAAAGAGVGSLSGELHGGANTRVMEMLMKIGSVDKVDEFLDNIMGSGGKIMGLGHAVYQTDDPRAHILAPMSKRMGERTGDTKWYELSKHLEQKGKEIFKRLKGKEIYVNVDFYSASLYYYMGIPIDLFTPVFAISRIAGWAAHIIEEQFGGADQKPVLYRPEAEYIGEYCGPDECLFVDLEDR